MGVVIMPTREDLKYFQKMPLNIKVAMTRQRIREWVNYYGRDGVYISFSGGKDSTVLLHIVRNDYPDIGAVFVDTGLEYPEIKQFVKTYDNVTILRPEMTFKQVIESYGYPIIGKEVSERVANAKKCLSSGGMKYVEHYYQLTKTYPCKVSEKMREKMKTRYDFSKYKDLLKVDFNISNSCCNIMKKRPIKSLKKSNITAQMAEESQLRTTKWLEKGCNAFDAKYPISNPMSFWTEQDVLQYIKVNNIKIASVYGDIVPADSQLCFDDKDCKLCTTGCKRTGCVFCGFGAHLEKGEGRFQRLKRTHPKLYDYCINGGEYNDEGLWVPNNKGLGMKHVFDTLNNLYGSDFLPYD